MSNSTSRASPSEWSQQWRTSITQPQTAQAPEAEPNEEEEDEEDSESGSTDDSQPARGAYSASHHGYVPPIPTHLEEAAQYPHWLYNFPPDPAPPGRYASMMEGESAAARAAELGTGIAHEARGANDWRLPEEWPELARGLQPFADNSPYGPEGAEYFTPSYLRGSAYMEQLEEQRHRDVQAIRASRAAKQSGLTSTNGSATNGDRTAYTLSNSHGSALAVSSPDPDQTYEIIEVDHTPTPRLTDATTRPLAELPSRWATHDKHASLAIGSSGGLDIRFANPRNVSDKDYEAFSVRANLPIPPQCGVFYYEVFVLTKRREDAHVALGFATKTPSLSRAPGWEAESWGYHGDDGRIFAAHADGKQYGPKFAHGDVVGCGINFRTRCAFFTRNGQYLDIAFREINKSLRLYPVVGMKRDREHVRANFGQVEFAFDIKGYVRGEFATVSKLIRETQISKLQPPMEEQELLQRLVLQFLQQDGHADTARALAEEVREDKLALHADAQKDLSAVSEVDDEDARQRRRIRSAILEGDLDTAMELTNGYYPDVIRNHEPVYFHMRCRKFIELLRREVEARLRHTGGVKSFDSGSEHFQEVHSALQQEDLQESARDGEDTDMDEMHAAAERNVDIDSLMDDVILYGKDLQAMYGNHPHFSRELDLCAGLLAFEDPREDEMAAKLLSLDGRLEVAEEVQAAILESLGKPTRPALETLYAQTETMLTDLSSIGGPSVFVSTKSVVRQARSSGNSVGD